MYVCCMLYFYVLYLVSCSLFVPKSKLYFFLLSEFDSKQKHSFQLCCVLLLRVQLSREDSVLINIFIWIEKEDDGGGGK